MANKYNQECITEDKKANLIIQNKARYNKLTTEEKKLFELARNAVIEIIPIEKVSDIDEEILTIGERFAFVLLGGLSEYVDNKLEVFKVEIENLIAAAIPPAGPVGGGPSI